MPVAVDNIIAEGSAQGLVDVKFETGSRTHKCEQNFQQVIQPCQPANNKPNRPNS